MAYCPTHCEEALLEVLSTVESLSLEQVIAQLPEFGWNEIFQAIDSLNRRGLIRLRRRGFDYEVALAHAGAGQPTAEV